MRRLRSAAGAPPRSRVRLAPTLLLALALCGGCRSTGQLADGAYEAAARCFAPNPTGAWGFFSGFGLGFVLGLPLCLVSWPLTLALYPAEEDAFEQAAALSPSLLLGTGLGALLALPLVPFGLPFTPDEPTPWTDEPAPPAETPR